jgi:cation/acetate symporter
MTTGQASGRREVADHLGRICGICAIGFIALLAVLAMLDKAAVAKEIGGGLLLFAPLASYAAIGLVSRTASMLEFGLFGRSVPAAFAGMAGGAEWMSAAVILGAASALFPTAHDGRAVMIGLTGGYILLAVLIVPFLRNSGAHTVPDFLAARYGGNFVRLLALIVLIVCSLIFAIALIEGAVVIASRVLGLNPNVAFYLALAVILLCAFPGGMRGVTTTQVAQYVVLFLGCVALFVISESQRPDASAAGPGYDPVIQALKAMARGLGLAPSSAQPLPFRMPEAIDGLPLILCLMLGTASFPHILARSLATPGSDDARASTAWSLLFIAPLLALLPTFVRLSSEDVSRELGGMIVGLVAAVGVTAMLATASGLLLAIANAFGHDVWHRMLAPRAGPASQLLVARLMLVAATALAAYAAATQPIDVVPMVAWAFSLAAAGSFPALVLAIWWTRTTTPAAIFGIIVGFGLSLLYLVVSRYYPQAGVSYFGMTALLDPADGKPLVNVAQVLADPRWLADVPASPGNPLASKIGWFNIGNLACGVFGLAAGFVIMIVVSLMGKRRSPDTRALIDTLRAPHSRAMSG